MKQKRRSQWVMGGKKNTLAFTVTDDEKKILKDRSEQMGISVAKLIRQCIGLEGN